MNTNSKRLGIYLIAMLILTVTATILRSIACVTSLDYSSGFFTNKSLITTANIIITVTVLGMFSYLFVAPRISLIANFSTPETYVTTGVLGVATAFLGARILSYVSIVSSYSQRSDNMLFRKNIMTLICAVCAILAFASILHHFFNAFITESKTEVRAYFALATILFLGIYAMITYLDPSLAIGESTKTLRLTTFILASLFFIYEARISLGREMWRIYTSFGLVAAALSAYTTIPSIITFFVNNEVISHANRLSLASIEESIFLLAMFIFITARLIVTIKLYENNENAFIKAFGEYAGEREREIAISSSRYNEIFASKQLSIFDLYGGEIIVDEENDAESETKAPAEEISSEPTISDDAIYESIFGRMPEKPEEAEETDEEIADEPADERKPEEIADEILISLENAINNASIKENKTENEENTGN